jgi:SAM-dependent methyltransferase
VFEHLPEAETEAALRTIARVLRPGGLLIVGVPQEVGPVAAAKGVFRWTRRSRQFDARPSGSWAPRWAVRRGRGPVAEIAPGRRYHPHHLGFDHRSWSALSRNGSPPGRVRERRSGGRFHR